MNKTLNKVWTINKTNYKQLLFTQTGFYLGMIILLGGLLSKLLEEVSYLLPLINYYVDVAKPVYDATGEFALQAIPQLIGLLDLLEGLASKALWILTLFIIGYSLLKTTRDWLFLKKQKQWYILLIIQLGMTLYLTTITIYLLLQVNSILGYLLLPFIYFILQRYFILLAQKAYLQGRVTWKDAKLLLLQLSTWIGTLILLGILTWILLFITYISAYLAMILIAITILILFTNREHILLQSVGERR